MTEIKSVDRIPLTMVRQDLEAIPCLSPPAPYTQRFFRACDRFRWADIEYRAGEFSSRAGAIQHFDHEFGPFQTQFADRCLLMIDDRNLLPVGTATAWFSDNWGPQWGRLHWVAVVPEHQGRGLGRALVGRALQHMALSHQKAYLTTQSTSVSAIKIYLEFGFEPYLQSAACREGWQGVLELLGHRFGG